MEGSELAYFIVALAAVVAFIVLLRRASGRQDETSAKRVRERLRKRPEVPEEATDGRATEARPEGVEELPSRAKGEAREDARTARATEALEEEAKAGDRVSTDEATQLKQGLARTRGGFVAKLGRLFARKKLDADILDELEQVLFSADIGPRAADKLFTAIKSGLSKEQLEDPDAVWARIREESAKILSIDAPPVDFEREHPFVLLVIGVNGVGKTTTIGKLAAKLAGQGKQVLLGAGDTFRAAATEQLEVWSQRANTSVVKGKSGGDPSSVIFDAIKRGADEDYDVVLCDTAGRLHTKVDLMEELKKVGRVCNKALPGSPHETWLVLDANTGQNAIQQAQMFKQAMNITGIVLTKLDGTAKGGVILGICDELQVPVRFIGIGEGIDDLREFDAQAFVDALYEQGEGTEAA